RCRRLYTFRIIDSSQAFLAGCRCFGEATAQPVLLIVGGSGPLPGIVFGWLLINFGRLLPTFASTTFPGCSKASNHELISFLISSAILSTSKVRFRSPSVETTW